MKKIEIEPVDHRVFLNDDKIPAVQLGNGDIGISSIFYAGDDDNQAYSGIAISLIEAGEIGRDLPSHHRKPEIELDIAIRIIATKRESIDTLITRLIDARDNFGSDGGH